MGKTLFDDKKSLVHFIGGLFSGILPLFGIFIFEVFLVYQLTEEEKEMDKHGDFIEFFSGYIFGNSLLVFILSTKMF